MFCSFIGLYCLPDRNSFSVVSFAPGPIGHPNSSTYGLYNRVDGFSAFRLISAASVLTIRKLGSHSYILIPNE